MFFLAQLFSLRLMLCDDRRYSRCLSVLLGSGRPAWARGNLWLVLLNKVVGEDARPLDSSVVCVFTLVPVGIDLFCNGDYLADREAEVVGLLAGVLIHGLDFQASHGGDIGGRQRVLLYAWYMQEEEVYGQV